MSGSAWHVSDSAWHVSDSAWHVSGSAWHVSDSAWHVSDSAWHVSDSAWHVSDSAWHVSGSAWLGDFPDLGGGSNLRINIEEMEATAPRARTPQDARISLPHRRQIDGTT